MEDKVEKLINVNSLIQEFRSIIQDRKEERLSTQEAYLHGESPVSGLELDNDLRLAKEYPREYLNNLPLQIDAVSAAILLLIARNNQRLLDLIVGKKE